MLGELKYALNAPERFAAAAVLSWAPYDLKAGTEYMDVNNVWLQNEIAAHGSIADMVGSRDDTWTLTGTMAGNKDLPRMYFSIGEEDDIYPRFKRYQKWADERGFMAEFHSVPGYGHEWRFWEREIQNVLRFFGLLLGGKEENRWDM